MAVQAARKRDIIVVALTGRHGGRVRDDVQSMGEQESA
jgi:phosphoheptose isomerase